MAERQRQRRLFSSIGREGQEKESAKDVFSIYLEGFPEKATHVWLRNTFQDAGKVSDVFIPRKRARSGNRFAFVRSRSKREAERVIQIWDGKLVAGNHLRVNLSSKERMKKVWRRKLGDVPIPDFQPEGVVPCDKSNKSSCLQVEMQPDEGNLRRLKENIIGWTKEPYEVSRLLEGLENEGWSRIWITRLEDRKFILGSHDKEYRERMKEGDWKFLRKWFVDVVPWSLEFEMRSTILRIQGLPLMSWNERNFEIIANLWGTMVKNGRAGLALGDARDCFLEIKTPLRKLIQEEVEVCMDQSKVKIWIVEKESYQGPNLVNHEGEAPADSASPDIRAEGIEGSLSQEGCGSSEIPGCKADVGGVVVSLQDQEVDLNHSDQMSEGKEANHSFDGCGVVEKPGKNGDREE